MDASESMTAAGGGPLSSEATDLVRLVEALLFSSEEPVSLDRLASVLEGEERAAVLDRYFEGIRVEAMRQGQAWERVRDLPRLWVGTATG